jgi:hypothetical protein
VKKKCSHPNSSKQLENEPALNVYFLVKILLKPLILSSDLIDKQLHANGRRRQERVILFVFVAGAVAASVIDKVLVKPNAKRFLP